ncbi:MAG: endonuclease III domain-containing protein [Candidatus Omnitrophota bacterium]
MFKIYGPRNWWPANSPFEVIVGAILTQNTSWRNVDKAIRNLKKKRKLSPRALHNIGKTELASLIRPSGYYNIKAKRLKSFIDFLFKKHKGSLKSLFSGAAGSLRAKLLNINGIGPETADSIILYAANKPVFVVDAYTKRILQRQGLIKKSASYEKVQQLFEGNLPKSSRLFNEYHALIVEHAKTICKKKPLCALCALRKDCKYKG